MSDFAIIEGDVVIRDSSGNELAIADAAALSSTKGLLVAGSDGTNARMLKVSADGTVAISAVSLPLPTGAATEATLVSINGKDFATETTLAAILADTASIDASIDVALSTRATEATQALLLTEAEFEARVGEVQATPTPNTVLGRLKDVYDSIIARLGTLGQKAMAGSTPVVVASDQSSIPVDVNNAGGPPDNRSATGTITALNGSVAINVEGCSVVGVTVTGTWVGTVIGEATVDGTNWFQINGYSVLENGAISSASQNGDFRAVVAGFAQMRVKASAYTSGTINVAIEASVAGSVTQSSISQSVYEAPGNQSKANLVGGGTFTGTASLLLGVDSLIVNLISDQPVRVFVEQSHDATDWYFKDVFNVRANLGVSRPIRAVSNYVRVRVENRSSTATTLFDLDTHLYPVSSPLPRALSPGGYLACALRDDDHDKSTQYTAFGIQKVAQETILGDYRFNADTLGTTLIPTTTGSGSYSIPAGGTGLVLSTGAAASSSIEVRSSISHAYKSGRGQMLKQSVILGDSGVAGNVREWGLADDDNGFFLRMDGTTLEWVIRSGGVETSIAATDWDVPVNPDQYGHIWYQQMEWLGVGDIYLYYDEKLVHTYRFIGTGTDFSIANPDLPVHYLNENTTNTTDVTMQMGCASVVMEGGTIISGVGPSGDVQEVKTDEYGRLVTTTSVSAPLGTVSVNQAYTGDVTGTSDNYYTIPTGADLNIQRLAYGSEVGNGGSTVELFWAPNGTTTGIVLIRQGFCDGQSDEQTLDWEAPLPGDGTRAILTRRRRFGGGAVEVGAFWDGFHL